MSRPFLVLENLATTRRRKLLSFLPSGWLEPGGALSLGVALWTLMPVPTMDGWIVWRWVVRRLGVSIGRRVSPTRRQNSGRDRCADR